MVGQVIYESVGQKKRIGTEGLFFYYLNQLCGLDQMVVVMGLSALFRHPKLSDSLFLEMLDVWSMLK